jgi:cysteine desulfurase
VDPVEVVFCASGTEAANLAVLGTARRLPADRPLVTWAAEHQAVLAPMRQLQADGRAVSVLDVGAMGRALLGDMPANPGLVSLGLANNETGIVQPAAAVAELLDAGSVFHLDCCQGPRWLKPPLDRADLASFSGHKLGAGRGGLLYVRRGRRLDPPLQGGPQEWGLRAGREDVAAATAVAVALETCAARRQEAAARATPLAGRLQRLLEELGGRPTGDEPRLPNYASAAFARKRGEDMLLGLDLEGLAASSGSACASGSLDPSHVLLAMGLTLEEALGSLRLTLGYGTTEDEVQRAEAILGRVLGPLEARAGRG